MNGESAPTRTPTLKVLEVKRGLFLFLALLLTTGAILRSAVATRLDSFTYDEAYHIAAGVSYLRHRDFRINPEHPPLIKLWAGSVIATTGFKEDQLRRFSDKPDERNFAEREVYLENDFHSVQRRARTAMLVLNGTLLLVFAFGLQRLFGPFIALGALLYLAIDPTVAAQLPLVMTDLPVSLLLATAVVLAIRAFQTWSVKDIALCSGILGLALATKHSAPIIAIFVVFSGAVLASVQPLSILQTSRWPRFAKLAALAAGAVVILWCFYFFRFRESPEPREVFNRPLASKIADVNKPGYRVVLATMTTLHVVPRAYLWGFADTIRAGLGDRLIPHTAFGHFYWVAAPKYFFPAMIALKLPIGLGVLVLMGIAVWSRNLAQPELRRYLGIVLAAIVFFLLVLTSGATYGGIRHALPVLVMFSVFAGVALHFSLTYPSIWFRIAVISCFLFAAISAVPFVRPWEYFNELIGGSRNAAKYFDDEGVDLAQRDKELAAYYHKVLEPEGDIPLILYGRELQHQADGVDWLGRDMKRDVARLSDPIFKGTILIGAGLINAVPFWDTPYLREHPPTARFGNLLAFRGTCDCAGIAATNIFYSNYDKMFTDKPNWEEIENTLRRSIQLSRPPFSVYIYLGNACLRRGSRENALEAYQHALREAPDMPEVKLPLEQQIKRLSTWPLDQIPNLRSPLIE